MFSFLLFSLPILLFFIDIRHSFLSLNQPFIPTRISTYNHMHTCTPTCMHMDAQPRAQTNTNIHIKTCTTNKHIHTNMHAHVHVCTPACMHTHMHSCEPICLKVPCSPKIIKRNKYVFLVYFTVCLLSIYGGICYIVFNLKN